MIYTTNAVEALNRQLAQDHQDPRQLPQRRGGAEAAVPRDQECRHALAAPIEWTAAMGQFAIQFGARFPGSAR